MNHFITCLLGVLVLNTGFSQPKESAGNYNSLLQLFREWRAFEQPPIYNGAPDYRKATFEKRRSAFLQLQKRLQQIDTTGWTRPQQSDCMIVWAEMNGYDFNQRVLKSWERDPAFYKTIWMERSDVPAHEGPTHHAIIDVWKYVFPLTGEEKDELLKGLSVIEPLNLQAQHNLTGNAKELWIAGIRDIRTQSEDLETLKQMPRVTDDAALVAAIDKAKQSTDALVTWLEKEASKKTGPSGIGKDNYTWYQQHVHLLTLTWDDEVQLLQRELTRAWTALKLEEHNNRNLPPLTAAASPEAYQAMAESAAKSLLQFLSQQDIVTVKPYFEQALRQHLGSYLPPEKRNFFTIGEHYDPRPLYSHFYHWFELARMDLEPHANVIRRTPLLYNLWDNRNEGLATAVEEIFMQAGLYNESPRSREIVYIMLAQRAARGLGSLYAHANIMTMEEAGGIHSEYTPRGWMKTEKALRQFEQHLYMRQPGYGSSYITGKYLIERAMADYAHQLEQKQQPFQVKNFMDQVNTIGCIPVSLMHQEITGYNADLKKISAAK
jgi:hypothetical protein